MKLLSRIGDYLLYFILLWCVFSFKVLLWGVGEAGLRVDDLLIVLAFALLIVRGDLFRIPRSGALRVYLVFILINLCSTVWNAGMGRVPFVYSTLFSIRLVQYLVFYYIGYALMESGVNVWRGLRVYLYVLCVVVPLQVAYIIPGVNRFGSGRGSGNTNGPYELATVAAFFLCYFAFQRRKWLGAAASLAILLLTVSRITIVGTILSFAWRLLRQRRAKLNLLVLGPVTMVATIAIGMVLLMPIWGGNAPATSGSVEYASKDSLSTRFQSALTLLKFDDAHALLDAAPVYSTAQDYFDGAFLDATVFGRLSDLDSSGVIRSYRWATLIKSTANSFDSILIGMGPSFGSAAVDGYFVRVFVESGVVGLTCFFLFLRALMKRKVEAFGAFPAFVVILMVTACFIDIFTSYKTMILLWLWHGMNEYKARQRSDANSLPDAG